MFVQLKLGNDDVIDVELFRNDQYFKLETCSLKTKKSLV